MQQRQLFHEDIYDALRTVVQMLGGMKRVGAELWPDKPITRAAETLANCLNRERAEKLDLEQVVFLLKKGRENGAHDAMWFLCTQAHYQQAVPIEPEDAKTDIQRDLVATLGVANDLMKRLEQYT